MIRKLFCAVFVMAVGVAIVAAEEAGGIITNVKDGTFTFQKTKKGEKVGEPVKMKLAKDGVVAKGVQDKEDKKKIIKGEKIDDGLANKMFAEEKGVAARVTYEGDTASQILVIGKKKKDNK